VLPLIPDVRFYEKFVLLKDNTCAIPEKSWLRGGGVVLGGREKKIPPIPAKVGDDPKEVTYRR